MIEFILADIVITDNDMENALPRRKMFSSIPVGTPSEDEE